MTAEELMKRYSMDEHVENGYYIERHYENEKPGRAASGSIYYYVGAGEYSEFHRIDCDEYWCYIKGDPLEIWQIDPKGNITVSKLGIEADCEPVVYIKQGMIFASKHFEKCSDGTFLSCITVPRFSSDGFELFTKDTILEMYPEIVRFFE